MQPIDDDHHNKIPLSDLEDTNEERIELLVIQTYYLLTISLLCPHSLTCS